MHRYVHTMHTHHVYGLVVMHGVWLGAWVLVRVLVVTAI